jgi:hypothetical protein
MGKIAKLVMLLCILGGCMPVAVELVKPDDSKLSVAFYPGGNTLEDLIIINGENYFGKAMYQFDDPVGDIGFKFNDGRKVRSECISEGKDIIGQTECKMYEVYRSNFDLIPEGTKVPRPQLF